ncbi:hypothetical protein ACFQDG_08130 [Natronoarchaeum mannanilyticum]|uniref:Uncharacterized protein n=1 Tax=Natronoarchaeum mannanilyticum TaxID=926360 RepID=A0AAV3TBE5_9EURY
MAGREPKTPREDVVPGALDPGASVLVHDAGDDTPSGLCGDLAASADPTGDVLVVEFSPDPADCLDKLANHPSTGRKRLLAVGDHGDVRSSRGDVDVVSIDDPADLSSLGIEISGFLSDGGETILCFHSLTDLLDHSDLERAFRFLHVLAGRVRAADAVAHFHIDPTAHEPRDLNTLAALFDGVVERFDGEWIVRTTE